MSKRLLLADDSVTIQKVIEITFADKDYILDIAGNGDEALQMAVSEPPDLILADVFMPGKNGYELCEAVRADARLKNVPVLLLAGTFEPFDQEKALAVGANDWIAKPFSSQSLVDKVAELLALAPVEERWQPTPSSAPVDQDIYQAIEEVTVRQAVSSAAGAQSVPVAAAVAPAAAELEPFDFSFEGPEESAAQAVDPFAEPLAESYSDAAAESFSASTELPDLEAFGPEPEMGIGAAIEDPFAAGETVGERNAVSDSVGAPLDFAAPLPTAAAAAVELPPLDDFIAAAPASAGAVGIKPEATPAILQLKESDILEEGPFAATAERVEKRVAFLSDEQLTQIVERVAGAVIARLATPLLEQVVWEVVPDLAESMVREEMAKIKAAGA